MKEVIKNKLKKENLKRIRKDPLLEDYENEFIKYGETVAKLPKDRQMYFVKEGGLPEEMAYTIAVNTPYFDVSVECVKRMVDKKDLTWIMQKENFENIIDGDPFFIKLAAWKRYRKLGFNK